MNRFSLVLLFSLFAGDLRADTILFESATLGQTGLEQFSVPATNVTPNVFTGVRFELTQPVRTSQVGGHFVGRDGGDFFGAVVALDDASDFPDSGDLTSSDVLGHAELTFPTLSDEVFGDLDLTLQPGFYALVFGSGLFNTNGDGAATRNNTDSSNPIYIGYQPGADWFNLSDLSDAILFVDHRFVVKGAIVPEPSTIVLVLVALSLPIIRPR
ncbi:MAG: hypothetical protein AAGD11_18610 [Planctomycetota bacterium]